MKARRLVALLMTVLLPVLARAITIDTVLVGNPGNAADVPHGEFGPYGSVAYTFAIGKYEVTNFQYATFLNAVAAVEDTYLLYPATDNPAQPNNPRNVAHAVSRGILQTTLPGGGFSYSVADNMADKPANFLTWFSSVRFVNWLANSQPTGNQTSATTENGAYALNGVMTGGFGIARNATNPNTGAAPHFWLPSEDEWYKAAFYDPELSAGSGGYWLYPTQSLTQPTIATATATGEIANPGSNVANYSSGVTWNGLNQNLTTVGSAGELSASAYGTFDQGGNVWEWSEGIEHDLTARGLRQGSANDPAVGFEGNTNDYLAASWDNNGQPPDRYFWNAGFRVATIPEPTTTALLLVCAAVLAAPRLFKRRPPLSSAPADFGVRGVPAALWPSFTAARKFKATIRFAAKAVRGRTALRKVLRTETGGMPAKTMTNRPQTAVWATPRAPLSSAPADFGVRGVPAALWPSFEAARKFKATIRSAAKAVRGRTALRKVLRTETGGNVFPPPADIAIWFCIFSGILLTGLPSFAAPEPVSEAIQAAATGDANALRAWIAAGGNPDEANEAGWTPLLIAAARGKSAAVDVLLNNPVRKADPGVTFAPSGALPIHMAGQSGDVATARLLLAARPSDIHAIWNLNGHTLLLQAAFYGHVDLARFALENGANPAATTLRGLTALDFAHQFDNKALIDVLAAKAPPQDGKDRYFHELLKKIEVPVPPDQADAQRRSDDAAAAIRQAIDTAGRTGGPTDALLASVVAKLDGVDLNRLAGDLRQPVIVIAVTGTNPGDHPDAAAALRLEIVRTLLDRGANPLAREVHPMGAHAIIRASVFGHLDILKLMGQSLTAAELAGALNEIPPVNGLTALHDAVLRSGTAAPALLPRYLDQIRWEVGNGARSDIEDFSGRTQRQYAEEIADPKRRKAVLAIFDSAIPMPQWNHPALAVPALEPAMTWYGDIFGFAPLGDIKTHTPALGERWKVATGIFGEKISQVRFIRLRVPGAPYGQVVELFEITPPPPPPDPEARRTSGYVHACMIVGDPETTAGRIAARGGKILSRTQLDDLTIIFTRDPWGNIIELASRPW